MSEVTENKLRDVYVYYDMFISAKKAGEDRDEQERLLSNFNAAKKLIIDEFESLRSRVEELEKENNDYAAANMQWATKEDTLQSELTELQTMLTACGFEVIEDYDKRKAIKGHGIIYMQDRTE